MQGAKPKEDKAVGGAETNMLHPGYKSTGILHAFYMTQGQEEELATVKQDNTQVQLAMKGRAIVQRYVHDFSLITNLSETKQESIQAFDAWFSDVQAELLQELANGAYAELDALWDKPEKPESHFMNNVATSLASSMLTIEDLTTEMGSLLKEIRSVLLLDLNEEVQNNISAINAKISEKEEQLITAFWTVSRCEYWIETVCEFLTHSEQHHSWITELKKMIPDVQPVLDKSFDSFSEHTNIISNAIYSLLQLVMVRTAEYTSLHEVAETDEQSYEKFLDATAQHLITIQLIFEQYLQVIADIAKPDELDDFKNWLQENLILAEESNLLNSSYEGGSLADLIDVNFTEITENELKLHALSTLMQCGLTILDEYEPSLQHALADLNNQYADQTNNQLLDMLSQDVSTSEDDEQHGDKSELYRLAIIDSQLLNQIDEQDWDEWLKEDELLNSAEPCSPSERRKAAELVYDTILDRQTFYFETIKNAFIGQLSQCNSVTEYKELISSSCNNCEDGIKNMLATLDAEMIELQIPSSIYSTIVSVTQSFGEILRLSFSLNMSGDELENIKQSLQQRGAGYGYTY